MNLRLPHPSTRLFAANAVVVGLIHYDVFDLAWRLKVDTSGAIVGIFFALMLYCVCVPTFVSAGEAAARSLPADHPLPPLVLIRHWMLCSAVCSAVCAAVLLLTRSYPQTIPHQLALPLLGVLNVDLSDRTRIEARREARQNDVL